MNDLDLLRKFEPVVCFTEGEFFFPCAVDEYLERCSLWLRNPKGEEKQLAAEGELSAGKIAKHNEVTPNHTLYLRFVEEPLEALEYQRWLRRPNKPIFLAPGRLTRVGLFSRMLDSLFSLSLVVRGKVPGGTAAAADIKYRDMLTNDPRYVYYGRVIREGGYIVLHYLFFYTMNNWRSGFYGVNDHEADWEQVFIYLSEDANGQPVPQWAAYASHDFAGDDLRRRWDDPELQKYDDTHPLVFAGAGSHASYFQPGEYLMGIEPAFLKPVKNGLVALRKFWVETLGQGDKNKDEERVGALLSVPFVDYARGDGLRIGPGQKHSWTPIILTEETGWSAHYRGLWGLDTKDPLGGERAPAGPKHNRDGSVRVAWYDPLGWAGLDKIPPPGIAPQILKEKIATLTQHQEEVARELAQKRKEVRSLALEVQALQQTDYFSKLYQTRDDKLDTAQQELQALYARHAELTETRIATKSYLSRIERGDWGDPQSHIHHKHPPEPPVGKQNRLAELWAAVSAGLLLLVFAVLTIFFPAHWFTWIIVVGGIFISIDAILRGWFPGLLLNVTILLGIITGIILVLDFWWIIVLIGLLALVTTMIRENLRELWRP
jgi:hypothetical protein